MTVGWVVNPTNLQWADYQSALLDLITNHAQEILAPGDAFVVLDALWRKPVDHAEDAASLFGLGHEYLGRVGRSAEDARDLRNLLDRVQDVYGIKAISQKEDE